MLGQVASKEGVSKTGRKEPALWTVLRAGWSHDAALHCAHFRIPLLAAIALASILALWLPFAVQRWKEASRMADPVQYPQLGTAMLALAAKDTDFAIKNGRVQIAGNPLHFSVAGWEVLVDDGSQNEETTPVERGSQTTSMLRIGPDQLLVHSALTGVAVAAGLRGFEGFGAAVLHHAATDRHLMAAVIGAMLHEAAFGSMYSSLLTMTLLTALQYMLFVGVLGALLSFAGLRARVKGEGARLPTGFMAGMKASLHHTVGMLFLPACLTGVAGFLLPGLPTPMLWLAFSFLAGVRALAFYTHQYRGS
ncbi:MAG: hypothetical protein WHT81_09535 [Rectinemataceae bacterium]|nr:hypothetical protein [Spirochaetaceae bacterium]